MTIQPIHPLILQALAMPKTHVVLYTYADGKVGRHETRSAASAKTHVDFVIKPRLNRDLIDRSTGKTVRIVDVRIEEI